MTEEKQVKTEKELKKEKITKYDALHNYVLTLGEAAELYDLGESTLRTIIFRNKLKEGTEVRKSGKTWLVTKDALIRYFGDLDENKKDKSES